MSEIFESHYEKLGENCGIVGIYSSDQDISRLTFLGIYSLQHRGQESAGIACSDGKKITVHKKLGLVNQVFEEDDLNRLKGNIAIGHTRYSTMGTTRTSNSQPIRADGPEGSIYLGHNGNVINALELKDHLSEWGINSFDTTSDSELIAQLYAMSPGKTWEQKSEYCMSKLKGAYSLVILSKDTLVGIRDPLGIRPLCLGKIDNGYVLASETCALDHIGAEFIRDIQQGETITINKEGVVSSIFSRARSEHSMCIFEQIYFSRPDSIIEGKLTYESRMAMGAELAKQHPVKADMVIGIPDSATASAVGYANESNIPFGEGLVKNRYVGRTFIEPDQKIRDLGVRIKFNPLRNLIEGKDIIVVDDSIVRGTTTPRVITILRQAGVKKIHVRVCAPPIISPCHFGVDMGKHAELIAARKSIEEIREYIGSDSLGYLSVEGLLKAVGVKNSSYCKACFTGKYPIPVQLEMDKMQLEEVS